MLIDVTDVAGLVAYMLSAHPELKDDAAGMKKLITDTATSIKIDKGTVKMAFNGVEDKEG